MNELLPTFFGVLSRLEEHKIPYMVVGSVATMVYGLPRMTHDLDVVVELQPTDATRLDSIFPLEDFYCPPPEVIGAEVAQRGQFNLIHHDSGLKIDLIIRKTTPHARAEFSRRRRVPFFSGNEVTLASPEDVIIKKLDYFRQGGSEKHLDDIRGIQAETALDDAYLASWIQTLGLQAEWARLAG